MNIESIFVDTIDDCRSRENAPKLSSKIKQWLNIDIPQSLCIRIGNYLEKFFIKITSTNEDLQSLNYSDGCYGVWADGEFHQIDFIKISPNCIFHRELKTNTDLDRGKKRDTLRREKAIVQALRNQFNRPVNSSIFCPFLITSQNISGLGTVEGLTEFLDNFSPSVSVEKFIELGRSELVHNALLK